MWEIGADGVRERWSLSAQETKSGIVGVAFSPDGTRVMAGDAGISAVKVWDLGPTGDAEWANLPAPGYPAAEFMPDGRRVVTSSSRPPGRRGADDLGSADRARPANDRTADRLSGSQSFDVSPIGESIALGGRAYAQLLRRLRRPGRGIRRPARSSRGSGTAATSTRSPSARMASIWPPPSWGGTAKIVDRSGRVIRVLQEEDGFNFSDVAFSSDGRLVATAAIPEPGDHVRIWDWERGEVRPHDRRGGILAVDFDPNGPRIVLAGSDGLAEIWDVESGQRVAVLAGPVGGRRRTSPSAPTDRASPSASVDGLVRLFDAETGAQQLGLRGSGCAVEGVAFSPDGTKLASTSWCDGVRIWALDIDDLLEIARREVPRSLTDEECRQYLHVDRCPQA